MLDGFMERLMQSAASAYMPKIEQMAEVRRQDLADMRSKIRSDPNAVEAWFDAEIEKVGKLDPKDLFGKIS
jgi:hypothetical protein